MSRKNGQRATVNGRSQAYRLNCALLDAAADGNFAAARKLIDRGANVNFQHRQGETPLTFSAAWNQLKVLKLLLAHAADPNIADRTGGTALMLAAQHGSPQMVRALLRNNADPLRTDASGHTALDHVAWRQRSDEQQKEIRELLHKAVTKLPVAGRELEKLAGLAKLAPEVAEGHDHHRLQRKAS